MSVEPAPQRRPSARIEGSSHRPATGSVRPRVAIYAVDQDARKTRSKGIYNYTRNLIRQFARLPDPGFELTLLLSKSNSADLLPPERPPWISAHVADGTFGRGVQRIFADHVLVNFLAVRLHLNLIHFPKGWLPIVIPRRLHVVATLNDAIPAFYRRRYPKVDPWRFRYFAWQTARTLRRANVILTISQASANQLADLDGGKTSTIRVIPDAPGLNLPDPLPAAGGRREGILVLGSLAPHKQTRTTLQLIHAWAEARSTDVKVTVVGLERLPSQWNISCRHMTLRVLGRVSDSLLTEEFQKARAVVLLSEIEGFGMPALESYALGTPVCYRAIPALVELLRDAPGRWDGRDDQTFLRALDEALALSPARIDAIRRRLLATYSWERCARTTVAEYRRALGLEPRPSKLGA